MQSGLLNSKPDSPKQAQRKLLNPAVKHSETSKSPCDSPGKSTRQLHMKPRSVNPEYLILSNSALQPKIQQNSQAFKKAKRRTPWSRSFRNGTWRQSAVNGRKEAIELSEMAAAEDIQRDFSKP